MTLRPGNVDEPGLELLGVLRARRPAGAALGPHRQRHLDLAARHVAVLRRLVDELLHGERQEVLVHDLDDGAHPLHRRADAGADERHLEIGVLRTRSGPNSSSIPWVTPIEPPISAMSSPMMKTSSSSRIACESASRTASRYVSSGILALLTRRWGTGPEGTM